MSGVLEKMQERLTELEAQNASLQRQLFMLAAAVGLPVVPHAHGTTAEIGRATVAVLKFTDLGLVQRGSGLYRPDDAPKPTAPKKKAAEPKLSKELSSDDLELSDLD